MSGNIINASNTLANIFASKGIHQQLEKAICIVWDEFEESKNPLFFDFVKVFHNIRPTETLLILKEKIDSLPLNAFDISSIDFKNESRNNSVNDDILEIIGGFHRRNELPEALDLLFDYYFKMPQNFMSFYHAINNSFGVRKDSHRYGYWTQIQLINKFIEHANDWKVENVNILFIRVAAQFLKLNFSPTEAGRGHTFTVYQASLQLNDGSREYRELLWNGLFELYHNKVYQLEIESIITQYGHSYRDEIEEGLVQHDSQFIVRFFIDLFSPLKLSHCIIAESVADQFNRLGVDVKPYLSDYSCSSEFIIYKNLKGERHLEEFDWQKEKELKESDIRTLLQDCSKETILDIIRACVEYQKIGPENTWDIGVGLQYAFSHLAINKELFLYAVDVYLANNTPLRMHPDPIVRQLFDAIGAEQTNEIINKYEFDQRNAWQFSFFKNLPFEAISNHYVRSMYEFLSLKEDKITSSPFREIEFLEKYKHLDNDVFIKAGRIIASKFDYSPFMFSL